MILNGRKYINFIIDPKDELSKIYRAIGLLKSGFCVIKYSSKQLRPNQRVIYLSENELVQNKVN